MTVYGWLISALWLALVTHWSLSSAASMRSIGSRWLWWREIAIRLGFFALVVATLQVAVQRHVLPNAAPYAFNSGMVTGLIGFVCAAFGVALIVLARICLGRIGDVPASGREQPELVTTGPYALVRHPLYGGMLLAILGSALGQSALWLLPLLVYGPYFILAARREEKRLIEQFPDRYRAYMKRTKMLLPFVL
jgi:protein-S-isoprenylcysteine O-methyltransferase Ste14